MKKIIQLAYILRIHITNLNTEYKGRVNAYEKSKRSKATPTREGARVREWWLHVSFYLFHWLETESS